MAFCELSQLGPLHSQFPFPFFDLGQLGGHLGPRPNGRFLSFFCVVFPVLLNFFWRIYELALLATKLAYTYLPPAPCGWTCWIGSAGSGSEGPWLVEAWIGDCWALMVLMAESPSLG